MREKTRLTGLLLVSSSLALSGLGCEGEEQHFPAQEPEIFVLAVEQPDTSEPTTPGDGRIVWFSTISGTAQIEASNPELEVAEDLAVHSGEVITTRVSPIHLEPDENSVEILVISDNDPSRYAIKTVGMSLSGVACTWNRHCGEGIDCIGYQCRD